MKFTKQNNIEVLKIKRKIFGFVGENKDGNFYAFGKPSQSSYIAFNCKSKEDAKNRLLEHIN